MSPARSTHDPSLRSPGFTREPIRDPTLRLPQPTPGVQGPTEREDTTSPLAGHRRALDSVGQPATLAASFATGIGEAKFTADARYENVRLPSISPTSPRAAASYERLSQRLREQASDGHEDERRGNTEELSGRLDASGVAARAVVKYDSPAIGGGCNPDQREQSGVANEPKQLQHVQHALSSLRREDSPLRQSSEGLADPIDAAGQSVGSFASFYSRRSSFDWATPTMGVPERRRKRRTTRERYLALEAPLSLQPEPPSPGERSGNAGTCGSEMARVWHALPTPGDEIGSWT